MRCTSYCLGKEIDISSFAKSLSEKRDECNFFDGVAHVQRKISANKTIDAFCFSFGSLILWGASEEQEKDFIAECSQFVKDELSEHPFDLNYYKIDESNEKTFIEEEENVIMLHKDSVFVKLSISHALAQSVKLIVLENSVSNLLEKTAPIQQELAKTGSVSLSKKDISKNIGMLFNERYSINLHSDILDTPEFFWRRPRYEPLYIMTAEFQDIQVRHNILNHRLDTIHELYSMLSNELNYIHSSRMEIIIIILIACEVLLGITNHGLLGKFLGNL
ncbi:MAG: RMD1 family protein [Rickettsiaceae bacterium]|nr:RMD1 family protein [Rickettsiaceae bacterium]